MARRMATTAEQDTKPESSGAASERLLKVKAEKVKAEKLAKAPVPGPEEDVSEDRDQINGDEDAAGEPDDMEEEDEQGTGSPRGQKRARVNINGTSRLVNGNEEPTRTKKRTATLPRDVDGFIPGSIVRIQLQNFVTYDWVEFCPGAHLNMILGPNGTGKSSIACAICLGLNWPPSVLGRASELNSFVKLGYDSGHIEIELKGPQGKSNLVVRRNLSAKSKGSTFTLNGNSATGKEITAKMAELNVQVGNLCSFLPQDKVSEFASMSPQQLLRETQRAAGDENLTSWHDTLISAGKELKGIHELLRVDRETLKTMQSRNDMLEGQVTRYKERRKIEQAIELLEVLIPVQEYREIRAKYIETKALQRSLHRKVAQLKEKNAPVHEKLKQLSEDYKEFGRMRDVKKKATQDKFKLMNNRWQSNEKLDADVEELTIKLDSLKKVEKDRIRKMKIYESDIVKLTGELQNPPDIEKEEDVQAEIRQRNLEFSGTKKKLDELQDRQRANVDESSRHQAEINRCLQELQKLDNESERKLQNLYKWDSFCADAVKWLRNNRDKFEEEVIEPPIICLTIPNKNYQSAVEACFNANQLKTFVCQTLKDRKTLDHHINDTNGLGRRGRINTTFRPKDNSYAPPPMSREELASLGFDGYAIDYVDCPDGLLQFLKKDLNLHRTAIGLNGSKIDLAKATEAVSRIGPNGEGGGANFIAGSTLSSVQRSRYGKRAAQNMTREIRPARNLVSTTVDPELKRTIDTAIGTARTALKVLEAEAAELTKEDQEIQREKRKYNDDIAALNQRKQAITEAQRRIVSMESRLKRTQNSLLELQNAPPVDVERANLKKKLLDITKKRMKIAKDYMELVRAAIQDQVEATRVGIEYLQVGANKTALEELCQQKDAQYNEAYVEFTRVDEEFSAIKIESKRVLDASREKVFGASEELRVAYEAVEAVRVEWENACKEADAAGLPRPVRGDDVDVRSTEELQAELETQQSNLEMNLNTNPGVVEQYEKRKKEIEDLGKTIEKRESNAEKIEKRIKNARDNWQPALETLVTSIGRKFSAAFDRIGCAGEIRISEHEDYDKWAIDILVKFRDNERLQLLTGQRQSGGERSLTTILYLMSLTEEARAPFSLVDEINQGMDQRAERMVHNSMVDVTCKADSAQYFLITPKLLPDLKYHERMKILCVNNGEWLPEERGLGNMMDMINTYVQRRDQTKAAGSSH